MFHLDEKSKDFALDFDQFLRHKRQSESDVSEKVRAIIEDVAQRGDAALIEYTEKFDGYRPANLAFSDDEIEEIIKRVPADQKDALELAASRIEAYHARQKPHDVDFTDDTGARLGWRYTPMRAAGIYVPGGLASYPSSVLMNAIPAKVAGVSNLVMCVPCPNDMVNPLVIYAAKLAGVRKIFRIGGAQAIAALAHGTASIPHVDMITGPGNQYVAEAKRQVFGRVGIDMIAGPSEVLVIADKDNNPDWVALDLLSQAEHDENAQAILITDNAEFALLVERAIDLRLETLERRDIARASWQNNGAIILAKSLQTGAHLANRIAPEHLQICTKDARALSHLTTEAGAIFLGSMTPEAIGDYVGGPNHVLPTSGTARFASGLNVLNFMKITTMSELTPNAMAQIGPSAVILAQAESLQAHALSVEVRLKAINEKTK